MSIDHATYESALAEAMIQPEQRSRFKEVSRARRANRTGTMTPLDLKRGRKFQQVLSNLENWIDPGCRRVPLKGRARRAAAKSQLIDLGVASAGYVMSVSQEIDGRLMELEEIFTFLATNQTSGTLVFWRDPCVAYFEQSGRDDLTAVMLGLDEDA